MESSFRVDAIVLTFTTIASQPILWGLSAWLSESQLRNTHVKVSTVALPFGLAAGEPLEAS